MNKNYNLKLDLQFRCNNSTMKFNQFDNNTSDFFMKISNGGKSFDIEKAIVVLAVIKPSGKVASQFVEVKNGTVYADLKSSMRDETGTYTAKAMLILEDERVVTDPISYEVEEDKIFSLLNDSAEDTEEFTLLTDMLSRLSIIETSEEQRMINEAERILAEENRKIEEAKRVEAELVRQHEEADRAKYDATRESNENIRKQNESIRLANETNRIDEESKRVEEENKRKLAEEERNANYNFMTEDEERRRSEANAHKEAEVLRVQAETDRVNEEAKRRTTEQARVSAENTRVNNENTREANELSRKNNENQRVEAETQRQNRYNSFIADAEANANNFENYTNNAKVKEEERKSNELDRKSQETKRVSNEVERISNENTRKANENARIESEKQRVDAENLRKEKIIEIQSDYDSLKKVIIDENASANLQNQINLVNSQLEHKANNSTVDNVNSRIDNLIINSGEGSGKDSELVDIRVDSEGNTYDLAGQVVREVDRKINEIITTFKSDRLNVTLPLVNNCAETSGWVYNLIPLTDKKWADYKYVFVALEISFSGLTSSVSTSQVNVAAKGNTSENVTEASDLLTTPTNIVNGETYILQYRMIMSDDKLDQYPDVANLFIQYGNSSFLEDAVVTVSNIFIKGSDLRDVSDIKNQFDIYQFTPSYSKKVDYTDINPINKPRIDGLLITKDTSLDEFKHRFNGFTSEYLNQSDSKIYENMSKHILYGSDIFISSMGRSVQRVVNDDNSVTYTVIGKQKDDWVFTNSLNVLKDWVIGHKYLIAMKISVDNYVKSSVSQIGSDTYVTALNPTIKSDSTSSVASVTYVQKAIRVGDTTPTDVISISVVDSRLDNTSNKQAYVMQLMGLDVNDVVTFTIYDVCVLDLTSLGLTEEKGVTLFNQYKYCKQDILDNTFNINVSSSNKASIADKAMSIENLDYSDVEDTNKPRIDGQLLTKDTSMSDFKPQINEIINDRFQVESKLLFSNKAKNYDISSITCGSNGGTVQKTINEDGSVSFSSTAINDGAWVYTNNITIPNFTWIPGNKYLIGMRVVLDEITDWDDNSSSAGNYAFSMLGPTPSPYNTGDIGSRVWKNNIGTIKADTDLISICVVDETKLSNAQYKNALVFQVGRITNNTSLSWTIKELCIMDLTELGLEESEGVDIFNKYLYSNEDVYDYAYNITVKESQLAQRSRVAEQVESINISTGIEIWGDSLVAQGYGRYISEILGRDVLTKGYGGKQSTYIRDKFLSEFNPTKTQIINVGRNNYREVDIVLQDIRMMVDAIPHDNFLICCPPNGNYGEGVGTSSYDCFTKLEQKLQRRYQSNFLNTREATIEEYHMGNVKLVNSFTQPQVGSSVTVKVSDAKFLTTFNSNDEGKWGAEFMNKIVIGRTIDEVDVYSINSYDLNANTLNITLLENNSPYKPGNTIQNGVDGGGLNSVKYCRVLQYADYYCYMNDITQSTFRSDGIHMSTEGQKCIANVVARKINTMKI